MHTHIIAHGFQRGIGTKQPQHPPFDPTSGYVGEGDSNLGRATDQHDISAVEGLIIGQSLPQLLSG
jgi:hypothetical protein